MREQDWRANYYEALRERNAAEAKLEKVATLVADLRFATGSEWVARMLDNILFPCQCPGEHCDEWRLLSVRTLTGRPARCDCDHCLRGWQSEHCACGHLFTEHREPWHICDRCLFCDTFRVSRDGR